MHCDGQDELGGGALFQGLGKFLAVTDEFAEEAEHEADAEGYGGGVLIRRVGIGGVG